MPGTDRLSPPHTKNPGLVWRYSLSLMSSQHPSRKHIIRKAILELLSDEYRNYLDANCANDIWRVSLALVHPAEDRDLFTHTSSWQPPSAATSLSTAASLEQLLIKCLAQGHPKVIGSPSSQHTCIHAFKIGHFCNTASECQIGYLRQQELKRCRCSPVAMHPTCW